MRILAAILIFLLSTAPVWSQKTGKHAVHRIKDLDKSSSDTVRIKAYVLDSYICPPCPEGVKCKPCMEDHIIVTEKNTSNTAKTKFDPRLRIITAKSKFFARGTRYIFIITFVEGKETKEREATLVSFKPL